MSKTLTKQTAAEEKIKASAMNSYRDAVELITTKEDPADYVRMRKDLGEWDDTDTRIFWKVYDDVYGDEKLRKHMADQKAIDAYAADLSGYPPLLRDVMVGIDLGRRDIFSAVTRPFNSESADKQNREASMIAEAHDRADDQVGAVGDLPDWLERGAMGASRSVYTASALSPMGGYGIIAGFGGIRGNQAITEATDAGLSGKDKWGYVGRSALIEGGIAGVFQKVGLGGFEKMMGGGMLTRAGAKEIFKQTGISLLQELPEEMITEVVDEYNQILSGVSSDEMSPERMGRLLLDTAIQTTMAVGWSGGVQGVTQQESLKKREAMAKSLADSLGFEYEAALGAVNRAATQKGNFVEVLGRELETENLKTTEGVERWASANLEQAKVIAGIEKPSRKDFDKAGLPRVSGKERASMAADLAEIVPILEDRSTQNEETSEVEPTEVEKTILADDEPTSQGGNGSASNVSQTDEVEPQKSTENAKEPTVKDSLTVPAPRTMSKEEWVESQLEEETTSESVVESQEEANEREALDNNKHCKKQG